MRTVTLMLALIALLAVPLFGGSAIQTDFTGADIGLGLLPPPPAISQQGATIHVRGFNGYSHIILTRTDGSTLFDGTGYFTLNANWLAADFTGPVWGTFAMTDTSGNSAETICHGVRRVSAPGTWQTVFDCTGVGTGGTVDGNLFRFQETITTHAPVPADFVGEITGSMVEPARQGD